MSWWSDLLDWINEHILVPSPLDQAPEQKKEVDHPAITTRKGKVVYARKKHVMNQKDLLRLYLRLDVRNYNYITWIEVLIDWDLVVISTMLQIHGDALGTVGGWLGDYYAGVLERVRTLLRTAGWLADQISFAEGSEETDQDGLA